MIVAYERLEGVPRMTLVRHLKRFGSTVTKEQVPPGTVLFDYDRRFFRGITPRQIKVVSSDSFCVTYLAASGRKVSVPLNTVYDDGIVRAKGLHIGPFGEPG